ncbi:MAG: hypothetical protein M0037_03775 [Betaproteobacteria bacterium]|nr:hypothetical protein [Betaproteobacteria bacterium]
MRYMMLVVLSLLACPATVPPAQADVRVGVSIGINVPVFPNLVAVPGYPVYYAPQLGLNYFYYDGLFWVFVDGNWYQSSWYDGPWGLVSPYAVPLWILRVPVRYYERPPLFFHGWDRDAPPRWQQHWGERWQERRHGWDEWNHEAAPRPRALPTYQRGYSGSRYPRTMEQRRTIEQHRFEQQRRFEAPGPARSQPMQRPPMGEPRGPREPLRRSPERFQGPSRGGPQSRGAAPEGRRPEVRRAPEKGSAPRGRDHDGRGGERRRP